MPLLLVISHFPGAYENSDAPLTMHRDALVTVLVHVGLVFRPSRIVDVLSALTSSMGVPPPRTVFLAGESLDPN